MKTIMYFSSLLFIAGMVTRQRGDDMAARACSSSSWKYRHPGDGDGANDEAAARKEGWRRPAAIGNRRHVQQQTTFKKRAGVVYVGINKHQPCRGPETA